MTNISKFLLLLLFFLPLNSLLCKSLVNKTKITDYSGFWESADTYKFYEPKSLEETQEIVLNAYRKNVPIRICGNHHSRNGFSLPRKDEILIGTKNLSSLEFIAQNLVKVGAGPNILHINQVLNSFNLRLPVINDGPAGPSLGGFISASGFGFNSQIEGGFWENVLEVGLIVGDGKVLNLKRSDHLFPWIFGSMGQLGVITHALLKVVPINNKEKINIPIGKAINLNDKKFKFRDKYPEGPKKLYWITFLATKKKLNLGLKELKNLRNEFSYLFEIDSFGDLEMEIKFKEFNPPLFFEENEDIQVFALRGYLKSNKIDKRLEKLEQKANILAQKFGYRRYLQSELIGNPEEIKIIWQKNYWKFLEIKKDLDPKFLFNQGLF